MNQRFTIENLGKAWVPSPIAAIDPGHFLDDSERIVMDPRAVEIERCLKGGGYPRKLRSRWLPQSSFF